MKIKVLRDIHGGRFEVRFLLEEFTEEEIFLLSRYGPLKIDLPGVRWKQHDVAGAVEDLRPLTTDLERLPSFTFVFQNPEDAKDYSDKAVKLVRDHLDSFVMSAMDFIGETVFEVKVGEEIRKIGEGARKALDKDSQEYKEIIEKNREAFEKLSKL